MVAVLWPIDEDVVMVKDILGPDVLSPQGKDVLANLVMLTPLTASGLLGWRRLGPWRWWLMGALVSVAAETAQLLPFLSRRASVLNVVENSLGAGLGVLCALVLVTVAERHAGRATTSRGGKPLR